jgi:hypothetical protein
MREVEHLARDELHLSQATIPCRLFIYVAFAC